VTAATDGDDRIGAANGPEHSGAFEPGADEGFATITLSKALRV
jgi:hypothetical protein